jgi:hypothetical protein
MVEAEDVQACISKPGDLQHLHLSSECTNLGCLSRLTGLACCQQWGAQLLCMVGRPSSSLLIPLCFRASCGSKHQHLDTSQPALCTAQSPSGLSPHLTKRTPVNAGRVDTCYHFWPGYDTPSRISDLAALLALTSLRKLRIGPMPVLTSATGSNTSHLVVAWAWIATGRTLGLPPCFASSADQ